MNAEPQKPMIVDERNGWTSASNAEYDQLCKARHLAQVGIPEKTTSDADFGRMIHDSLATGNTSKLDGAQLSVYDQCFEITDKLIVEYFGPNAKVARKIKEERIWCKVCAPNYKTFGHSGKPDLVLVFEDRALVIEYKTLLGDVADAPSNMQLRDQAVLVRGSQKVKTVATVVVQPLVTHSPVLCEYDEASLKQAESEMFARVTASNDPTSKRTAGQRQCNFCLARSTCQSYLDLAALAVANEPMFVLAKISVKDWTPMQRAIFCERMPLAFKWLAECKEQLKDELKQNPDSVPGFTLADGNKVRSVTDLNELHGRFLAAGGTTKDFLSCMKIGMGNLETAVRAVSKLKGKSLKEKVDQMLDGIVEMKQNDSSIESRK